MRSLFGGGSRSNLLCTLIADTTDLPVLQMQTELANYGAVLLSVVRLNTSAADQNRFAAIREPVCFFQPDPARMARYRLTHQRYCALEAKLLS